MKNETTVIAFSKDRPLQMHAYLESLIKYADIEPRDIFVIYKETESIKYSEVISMFDGVNWIKEESFFNQVREIVNNAKEFIMFGCDDVVFTREFSLDHATSVLADESVFGYTARMGTNIHLFPEKYEKKNGDIYWNWRISKLDYCNYPWELDCTVYRKQDVIELISTEGINISNPNYLESEIAKQAEELVHRDYLVCSDAEGKAICITVNRVQDTHLNEYDHKCYFDVIDLYNMYKEGTRLDIERVAKKKTDKIHVGAEFLLLKGNRSISAKLSILDRMLLLLKNIHYLTTVNLRKSYMEQEKEILTKVREDIDKKHMYK